MRGAHRPETGPAQDLAERMAQFALQAVPSEAALEMTRLCLFDWSLCAVAGASQPVARIRRAQAEAEGGAAQSSLIGSPALRVPPRAAALANGATSHALDYDDTHLGAVVHTSVAVLPAALAVAERQGASGDDLLRAAAIGAETAIRVAQWLGPEPAAQGFHPTAIGGALGASVAAGLMCGLDAEQMVRALAIASTRAAGIQAVFGSMAKPLNAGGAAAAGVLAADLAGAGLTAPADALDGPQGFGHAHGGTAEAEALHGLGTTWHVEAISFKFHACCHGLHAMLEAVSELSLAPQQIDRVTVRTHPRWRGVCDRAAPTTGLEAKFSFRFAAALALAGRDTGALESFSAEACADPGLTALRDRVDVVFDEALPITAAMVDVTASGGRAHRVTHDLATPVPPARVRARLDAKAQLLLGDEGAAALAAATRGVVPDLAALTAELRHAQG